jgi:hypothetical protein
MTTDATLIALESAVIDQSVLIARRSEDSETHRASGILKSSLTLVLCAVELLVLGLRKAFLGLDGAAGHGHSGIPSLLYALTPL